MGSTCQCCSKATTLLRIISLVTSIPDATTSMDGYSGEKKPIGTLYFQVSLSHSMVICVTKIHLLQFRTCLVEPLFDRWMSVKYTILTLGYIRLQSIWFVYGELGLLIIQIYCFILKHWVWLFIIASHYCVESYTAKQSRITYLLNSDSIFKWG